MLKNKNGFKILSLITVFKISLFIVLKFGLTAVGHMIKMDCLRSLVMVMILTNHVSDCNTKSLFIDFIQTPVEISDLAPSGSALKQSVSSFRTSSLISCAGVCARSDNCRMFAFDKSGGDCVIWSNFYATSDLFTDFGPNLKLFAQKQCYHSGQWNAASGSCDCPPDYNGKHCQLSSCSGHGEWHLENQTCTCHFGFNGDVCSGVIKYDLNSTADDEYQLFIDGIYTTSGKDYTIMQISSITVLTQVISVEAYNKEHSGGIYIASSLIYSHPTTQNWKCIDKGDLPYSDREDNLWTRISYDDSAWPTAVAVTKAGPWEKSMEAAEYIWVEGGSSNKQSICCRGKVTI